MYYYHILKKSSDKALLLVAPEQVRHQALLLHRAVVRQGVQELSNVGAVPPSEKAFIVAPDIATCDHGPR